MLVLRGIFLGIQHTAEAVWYGKNNRHFEGSDPGLVCLREGEVVCILASVLFLCVRSQSHEVIISFK